MDNIEKVDKLDMKTSNLAEEKFKQLQELFPNAVTETVNEDGEVVKAIDKDILMQEISSEVVEGREERYQFTWPDKRNAILTANAPISKTLRPSREESLNFDETENLYIEGDNLEVLKLLQETYLGKIKMIYIDPPYNTGNDFVYNDDFKESAEEYLENSGQYDEEGNRLEKNIETNGRFHTDWLNMMYPRLKLARNLLSDDGVIFISIDDKEVSNLKKICDEIFGERNIIANIIWQSTGGSNTGNSIITITEYILVYAKQKNNTPIKLTYKKGKYNLTDVHVKSRGKYERQKLDGKFTASHFSNSLVYPICLPNGEKIYPGGTSKPKGLWNWRWSKKKVEWGLKNDFIEFVENKGSYKVYFKNYENVDNNNTKRKPSVPPKNIIDISIASTSKGTTEINELFDDKLVFEFTKSKELLFHLLNLIELNRNDIILDFFSGSSTTAHAVMQLNAEDGGKRKFIMVQLPEETDENSEAYKAGYKNICEIGKERIRRAGQKILKDNENEKEPKDLSNLDIGFRVLKVDTSNMKDVYYSPEDIEKNIIEILEDNIKEDRSPEDLLFQVMLDLGIPLSSKIDVEEISGKQVYIVEDGFLIACFDKEITENIFKEIAKKQPYYAVFRDCSMKDDSAIANFDQIFKYISPETIRKVL